MHSVALRTLSLVLLPLLLSACATGGSAPDINDPANSLVFAYIDMDDAPTDVTYAHLQRVLPKTDTPYWGMLAEDGIVYNPNLPNGAYQLSNFGGGGGFFSTPHEYNFPTYGKNQTAVRIDQPGIYFLGSYKYEEVDTGFFEQDKFTMKRTADPAEAALLRKLLTADRIPGSQWEARIRQRLAEIEK